MRRLVKPAWRMPRRVPMSTSAFANTHATTRPSWTFACHSTRNPLASPSSESEQPRVVGHKTCFTDVPMQCYKFLFSPMRREQKSTKFCERQGTGRKMRYCAKRPGRAAHGRRGGRKGGRRCDQIGRSASTRGPSCVAQSNPAVCVTVEGRMQRVDGRRAKRLGERG